MANFILQSSEEKSIINKHRNINSEFEDVILYGDYINTFGSILKIPNKGIEDLTGIEQLYYIHDDGQNIPVLKFLDCSGNNIKRINLDRIYGRRYPRAGVKIDCYIETLICENNQIKNLTLNKGINFLNCNNNKLTELDLSKSNNISALACDKNEIKSLSTSNLSKLEFLSCNNNSVGTLDLSNNKGLKFLSANSCDIRNIDLRNNKKLIWLMLDDNHLSELNTENFSELKLLRCYGNRLQSLNTANLSDLYWLDCSYNLLKKLDLTKNAELGILDCTNTGLSSLNIGNNLKLKQLNCSKNKLTRLDISSNHKDLTEVNCSDNEISSTALLGNITSVKKLNISNNKLNRFFWFGGEELDCSGNAIPYLANPSEYFSNLKSLNGNNQQISAKVYENEKIIWEENLSHNLSQLVIPDADSKVKEISGGKIYDIGADTGKGIKVDDNLPEKVKYQYEVKPGMYLDVTLNIQYIGLDPSNVVSMKIKDQPAKLTYTDGEKLDLSGLVVTLEDNKGLTKDVAFKDFGKYNINTSPANGTPLTLANNAKKVTLTKESLTAETDALTVNAKIVGPVDPSVNPNPSESTTWTVTFAADAAKGTVDAKNTFYVLRTENKTLADLANEAPKVTAKQGFKFVGWEPALEANNAIDKNITVNAKFVEVTPAPQDLATAEDKKTAKEEIGKLPNLTNDEKAPYIKQVDDATTKGEVAKAVEDAKAANDAKANQPATAEDKKAAKEEIGKLPNLTNDEKAPYIKQVDDATTKGEVAKAVEDAKAANDAKANQPATAEDKKAAKEEIGKLPNLTNDEKAPYIKQVDDATTKGEVAKAVEDAKAANDAKANQPATPSYPRYEYNPFWNIYFGSTNDKTTTTPQPQTSVKVKLQAKLVIGSKEMIKTVDGVEQKVMMDIAPFIDSNRTMLPIRFVAEALGFKVEWDDPSRTVILTDKDNVVRIPVDTNKIIVNGNEYESDVKPVLRDNRTMLPIGNIARALGLVDGKDIIWDAATRTVVIKREIEK